MLAVTILVALSIIAALLAVVVRQQGKLEDLGNADRNAVALEEALRQEREARHDMEARYKKVLADYRAGVAKLQASCSDPKALRRDLAELAQITDIMAPRMTPGKN